jgi:hypothetical protein
MFFFLKAKLALCRHLPVVSAGKIKEIGNKG